MSSTNRRLGVRSKHDHYETPRYTLMSLLAHHQIKYPVLEPCAGYGSIANILKSNGEVVTNDIDSDMPCDYNFDYLNGAFSNEFETILTNPPFNVALEIIEKALCDVIDCGSVIMLLRLNFMGSQKRKSFWIFSPLKHVYVLSNRPCFVNRKSDSTEYAWFVFQRGYTGEATIEVIS